MKLLSGAFLMSKEIVLVFSVFRRGHNLSCQKHRGKRYRESGVLRQCRGDPSNKNPCSAQEVLTECPRNESIKCAEMPWGTRSMRLCRQDLLHATRQGRSPFSRISAHSAHLFRNSRIHVIAIAAFPPAWS